MDFELWYPQSPRQNMADTRKLISYRFFIYSVIIYPYVYRDTQPEMPPSESATRCHAQELPLATTSEKPAHPSEDPAQPEKEINKIM